MLIFCNASEALSLSDEPASLFAVEFVSGDFPLYGSRVESSCSAVSVCFLSSSGLSVASEDSVVAGVLTASDLLSCSAGILTLVLGVLRMAG